MDLKHKPVQYVDHNYQVHSAVSVYLRDASEFSEEGEPRITLLYFPDEGQAELLRGNVSGAMKVVYDVKSADHPDHARYEEKVAIQERSPSAGPQHPLGLVTRHESTGFMVKPGGFYLEDGEPVPSQRLTALSGKVTKISFGGSVPIDAGAQNAPPSDPDAVHVPLPTDPAPISPAPTLPTVHLATLIDGHYDGVILHFPDNPGSDKTFYKERQIAAYMQEHGIDDRAKVTQAEIDILPDLADDFTTDVELASKWLTDHNLAGKLDDSVIAYREKLKADQAALDGHEGSQSIQ